MKSLRCLSGLLCLLTTAVWAGEKSPWVTVQKGASPIILVAPHGGRDKPVGLIARRYGKLVTDENTYEMTLKIAGALEKEMGAAPYAVLSRMHRSRLDPNRELREAAQGSEAAAAVWRAFHGAIDEARGEVTSTHGFGLVLDLHGHRHREPNVELGYGIPGRHFEVSDVALSADAMALQMTSMRDWISRSGLPLAEVLRGHTSLGALLEKRGQRALPSPERLRPSAGEPYFTGAYDIARHGSSDGGSVSAIQVECPWEGVRDTEANQQRFAERFAAAVAEFVELHTQHGNGAR